MYESLLAVIIEAIVCLVALLWVVFSAYKDSQQGRNFKAKYKNLSSKRKFKFLLLTILNYLQWLRHQIWFNLKRSVRL